MLCPYKFAARAPTKSKGLTLLPSIFDELAQAAEGVVPLLGDECEVVLRVFEATLVQLPDAFAPVPHAAQKTCCLHHVQVFGDRLTSDVGARGELSD
jgi:hypothetical protein